MYPLTDASDIIQAVSPYTMTTAECLTATVGAVRYVLDQHVAGDIVECGVWKGGSSMAMALALLERQSLIRRLWLFDTFQGMTAPQPIDGQMALESYQADPLNVELAKVKAAMSATYYPEHLIRYIVGPVEETLAPPDLHKIAVLRLDTDWYSSTKVELERLWPLLSSRGVLILDDYDCWVGCWKAVHEFFGQDIPNHHRVGAYGLAIIKD